MDHDLAHSMSVVKAKNPEGCKCADEHKMRFKTIWAGQLAEMKTCIQCKRTWVYREVWLEDLGVKEKLDGK